MDKRLELQETFLANAGWAGAQVSPLAADASFRSYHRVKLNDRGAVLMDAPPPKEAIGPFVNIARYLTQLGFSAPRILAEDEKRGFILLEDLGDDTYTNVIAGGGDAAPLYELAIDTLVQLHALSSASTVPKGIPPYDIGRLMDEAALFADWYMPAITGNALSESVRRAFDAAWEDVFASVSEKHDVLVLRDFHVDNLMWLPERNGTRRCGLLDFQDALVGAHAYDLMSLVEDARRDVDPHLAARLINRYLEQNDVIDAETLARDMAVLGAGRHAKVIGIFTRLCHRDGKSQYLMHIPRVWRLLECTLEHPALAPVAKWYNEHVPVDLRRIPDASGSGVTSA